MFAKYPDLLTIEQTAEALSVCKNTVYKLICNGELRALKITGRCFRVPKIWLIEYVTSGGIVPPPQTAVKGKRCG